MPLALTAGLIAAAVTCATLIAALAFSRVTRAGLGVMAAIAAGALITAVLTHLLPEAFAARADAPLWALAGFAGAYLFNRGALAFGEDEAGKTRAAALAATAAIAFHSFIDGLTYAVTFGVDAATGTLTAVGLILHEAPEAVIVLTLLIGAGFGARAAFALTLLAAGLTTPAGAALGLTALDMVDAGALAILLAVAGGVLLFVSAGHLLPHVEREPAVRAVPGLAAGAALVLVIAPLVGHAHAHLPSGDQAHAHDHHAHDDEHGHDHGGAGGHDHDDEHGHDR